jgi:hypothetical protein
MSELSNSWKYVLELKSKIQELKLEIKSVERFLANPFANKLMSPDRRKKMYEKALRRKSELVDELQKSTKLLNVLTSEHYERVKVKRGK